MTFKRTQLVYARISLREADDAALTAIMRQRDPDQFRNCCEEFVSHLTDVAAELGFNLVREGAEAENVT